MKKSNNDFYDNFPLGGTFILDTFTLGFCMLGIVSTESYQKKIGGETCHTTITGQMRSQQGWQGVVFAGVFFSIKNHFSVKNLLSGF
jgi:hypothetical protein